MAMRGRPTQLVTGVSRRALALNPYTWFATGGMFGVFGVAGIVMALASDAFDQQRLLIFGGLMTLTSLWLLCTRPPSIGTRRNHVVLIVVYGATSAGMYAFQPGGAAAIGASMFIGPLTAVRLLDRRQIAAHYIAATVCLMIAPAFGLVDRATVLAGLTLVPSMWVLGTCCVAVLEAAEAQGDELEWLVRRDPLTGVGNRRHLAECLPEELERHGQRGALLSLVTLDLNGFKALNDTLGHAAGDALLRDVAGALTAVAGADAIVIRQGGDEFCVILPDTSAEQAQQTAVAIATALEGVAASGLPVTSGLGIASFPHDGREGELLLHVADERLREHKAAVAVPRPVQRRRIGEPDADPDRV